MRYTRIVLFGLVLVMVVSLVVSMARLRPAPGGATTPTPAGGETPAAVAGYLVHRDEASGFTIYYPEDWTPIPQEWQTAEVVGGYRDDSDCGGILASFRVGTRDEPSAMSVQDYSEALKEDYAAVEGCAFVGEEELTVAGVEAIEQVYTLVEDEVTVKRKQIVLVQGTRVWFIVCDAGASCWGAYEPIFDTVVNSFQLLP